MHSIFADVLCRHNDLFENEEPECKVLKKGREDGALHVVRVGGQCNIYITAV